MRHGSRPRPHDHRRRLAVLSVALAIGFCGIAAQLVYLQILTGDRLAELSLLRPVVERLGARATLRVVEDADHAFHVPKRTGKTDDGVLLDVAGWVARWADQLG